MPVSRQASAFSGCHKQSHRDNKITDSKARGGHIEEPPNFDSTKR